ncbi:MAG: phosphotransferase family protein [Novosphingobium sp.]
MAEGDWRDLVNVDRLREWMDVQGLGSGPLDDARPLGGGSQNILVQFERQGRSYVLRRPPQRSIANGNRTMRREARFLSALRTTDVPHPQLIAQCDDEAILGAAFYLMEPVNGYNVALGLPDKAAQDPGMRRRMGFSLIDSLVKLAAVDYVAVGLADMGKLDGFIERQVGRWRMQFESYREFDGWTVDKDLAALNEIAVWLDANRPNSFVPGIMHGDYHLANVMFHHDTADVVAIIDWEMATIGDPLIDLGWALAMWHENGTWAGDPIITPWDGLPEPSELIERYGRESGRDVSNMRWYRVMACYKLAIVLEGTYARSFVGMAAMTTGQSLHQRALALTARAHDLIDRC